MSRPHIKISLLSSIFISILSIFVMSHNAGAIGLTRDVELIRGNFQGQINVFDVPSGQVSNVSQCNLSVGSWTSSIFLGADCGVNGMALSIPQMTYKEGDWIVINLNTSYPQYSASNHMVYYGAYYSGSNPVDLLQQEVSNLNTNSGQITLYFRVYNSFTDNALNIRGRSQILNANTTNSTVILRVNSVSVYREKDSPSAQENADAIADKQESATQDASDAAQDSADSSQQDTDATGTSLLSVFTSVIGVIINSQETTCTFDSHLPFMSGAGTIDLCMFDPPAVVQTISSLLALALFVPFGLHMYNRFISITRSFQR